MAKELGIPQDESLNEKRLQIEVLNRIIGNK
jgi:hypothetical protein